MKLITFQSMEALRFLINHGCLICDESRIQKEKYGAVYDWVASKMKLQTASPANAGYPIWAWVKCYHHICPPKRRGERVRGFDAKITFHKEEKDVFITDFRRYSFLLNNRYIPSDKADQQRFAEKLKNAHITPEELKAFVRRDLYQSHRTDREFLRVCEQIRQSFDRCVTRDSDLLQGCVWSVCLDEIDSIEILKDDGYAYGSLNYKRADGKGMDWIKDFYKKIGAS